MPVYSYSAKDLQGEYHRGEVETLDEYHASTLVRRKKLILISLKLKNDAGTKFFDKFFSRVSFSQIVILTRQLATMVQAGLVLAEALDILEEQEANKKLKKVLKDISVDVKGGLDFASAIEKHPDAFPPLYSKLIKAGQASGKLDTILLNLSTNLEKEREFKSKVKGALVYPAVVISMMFAVMTIMVVFVVPKMLDLYKESNIALPLPTRIMIGLMNIFQGYWWLIIILVIIALTIIRRFRSTPEGKIAIDTIMLKIPVIGKIISLVIMTSFTRTLALLISSGLSILESIKIVSDVVGNNVYKEGLEISYRGVERGLSLSSQLLGLSIFPRIVGQMVKTGEETGKIDEIMFKMADYFEAEADNSLKNATTLIEPLFLVILGLGVGFLAIAIILPIYQMSTNIK